jgi:E3 ubiquitin-protein ligase TRIP12
MYRGIPVANKICHRKEQARDDARMRMRIDHARPGIDMRPPATCHLQHMRVNLKREQLLEDRYLEIDRENRILLQKMSDVMRKPAFEIRPPAQGRSITKDRRKLDLIRITQDNQALLRRIQTTQPVYRHLQWEEAYRRNELYLRNACEYPVVLRKQSSAPVVSPSKAKQDTDRLEQFLEEEQQRSPTKSARVKAEEEEEPETVFKAGQKVGDNYFLVEMSTDGRTLTISAYDGDTQQTLELMVNEKNHRRLHKECDGDYGELAGRLAVEDNRLLVRPLVAKAAPGTDGDALDAEVRGSPQR